MPAGLLRRALVARWVGRRALVARWVGRTAATGLPAVPAGPRAGLMICCGTRAAAAKAGNSGCAVLGSIRVASGSPVELSCSSHRAFYLLIEVVEEIYKVFVYEGIVIGIINARVLRKDFFAAGY